MPTGVPRIIVAITTGIVKILTEDAAADDRFAGATYDPTSHYRAGEVFDFFIEHHLDPALLRRVSQHQIDRLRELFDGLDLDPGLASRDREVPLERLGGFLALRAPRADALHSALSAAGVATDFRSETLRLGPAPYLSGRQLEESMRILGDVARALPGAESSGSSG